ncbi:MAG: 50S ribosomal protein L22 [Proteobacteria bacterium]|nr:50S ribosomal protein L22 [Pseudomonadota bacterium]
MEIRAALRNYRMGARKGRLVADLIRNRPCSQALDILAASDKAAAVPIAKLLRSALANAEEKNARQSAGIDLDNLFVKSIQVDEGKRGWRIRPRAQGRAYWINKASSHVMLVLDER